MTTTKPSTDEIDARLSKVSKSYDVGGKGYLTDVEKTMRAMDVHNEGSLSNAQVAEIVSKMMELREKHRNLKLWAAVLAATVVILSLSNLGTAFAAAHLAKDTAVDTSSGLMKVKNSGMPVTTLAKGQSVALPIQVDGNMTFSCGLSMEQAAYLWNSTAEGVSTNAIFQKDSYDESDSNDIVIAFSGNGATINETHACLQAAADGILMLCIDFTDDTCDEQAIASGKVGDEQHRRILQKVDHHQRRRLFKSIAKTGKHRQLFLDFTPVVKIIEELWCPVWDMSCRERDPSTCVTC